MALQKEGIAQERVGGIAPEKEGIAQEKGVHSTG